MAGRDARGLENKDISYYALPSRLGYIVDLCKMSSTGTAYFHYPDLIYWNIRPTINRYIIAKIHQFDLLTFNVWHTNVLQPPSQIGEYCSNISYSHLPPEIIKKIDDSKETDWIVDKPKSAILLLSEI